MVFPSQTLTGNSLDMEDIQVLLGPPLLECLRLPQELQVELALVWELSVNKALRIQMQPPPPAKLKDSGLPVTLTLIIRITGAASLLPFDPTTIANIIVAQDIMDSSQLANRVQQMDSTQVLLNMYEQCFSSSFVILSCTIPFGNGLNVAFSPFHLSKSPCQSSRFPSQHRTRSQSMSSDSSPPPHIAPIFSLPFLLFILLCPLSAIPQ